MKMLNGRSWAYLIGGAAGALVLSAAGGAWSADDLPSPSSAPSQAAPAAETPEMGAGRTQPTEGAALTTESSLTVTSIDRSARRVTVKDPAGEKTVVSVPKDVKGFDRLKVGDRIDIDYYESVAVSILPPGTKPGATERMGAVAGKHGEAMGEALTVTAKVVNVDAEANEVTFKGPRGMNRTVKVQDPDLQRKLPDLKAGDEVQLTYTEAAAAAIRPAASAK